MPPKRSNTAKGKKGAKKEPPKTVAEICAGLTGADLVAVAQEGSLAWGDGLIATPEQLEGLIALTGDEYETAITTLVGMGDSTGTESLKAITRDYYVTPLWFAKENSFSLQQASALFNLMHRLLVNCRDQKMSLLDNLEAFKALMLSNGSLGQTADLPNGVTEEGKVFDFDDRTVPLVANFVISGLFQHYRLYDYLFHGERSKEPALAPLVIDIPLVPPLLDEAQADWETAEHEAARAARAAAIAEAAAAEAAAAAADEPPPPLLLPKEAKAVTEAVIKSYLAKTEAEVRSKMSSQKTAIDNRLKQLEAITEKNLKAVGAG